MILKKLLAIQELFLLKSWGNHLAEVPILIGIHFIN